MSCDIKRLTWEALFLGRRLCPYIRAGEVVILYIYIVVLFFKQTKNGDGGRG